MGLEWKESRSSGLKKATGTVKKVAKKVSSWKKKRHDDSEALIESDDGSGSRCDGRSIEVLPGDSSPDEECQFCGHSPLERNVCIRCGRRRRQGADRSVRVRFSPDVSSADALQLDISPEPDVEESRGKKRKKYKRLKKVRRMTWKMMKGSWKFMRDGIHMVASTPGIPTGPVNITNMFNNAPYECSKKKSYK